MISEQYPKFKNAVLLCLLLIILQIVTGIISGLILGICGYSTESFQYGITVSIVQVLSFGMVILIGFRKTKKNFNDVFRFVNIPILIWFSVLILAVGLTIISSEIDNLLNFVFPMPNSIKAMFNNLGVEQNIVVSIILMVFIPAITEEMFFRGIFISGFSKNYSFWKAILLSSLLFGLIHLNPWQFITGFIIGVPVAYVFLKSNSIIPCMIIHAFNNLLYVFTSRFQSINPIKGFNNINNEKIVFQPIWFDILGVMFLLIGFYFIKRIYPKKINEIAE